MVLDGTNATFTYANNGFLCIYTQANSPFYGKIALGEPSYQSLCDHFIVQPNGTTWVGRGKCGFNSAGAFWLMHTDTTITTVAQFNTWLASNPTTFYYALAEPVDEEITNETLISQLEALEQAHSYEGRTHVMALAATGNAPHILAVEAVKSNNGTITNSGNYFSKPKLTIYGSGDIGIYLNGLQIFQIALGDEEYITIDMNAMEAYKDTPDNLKNRLVTGDYENFALQVGENQITFSGNVTKCIVENYSRWL